MTFPDYSDAVDVAQLQAAVAQMINDRTKSGSVSAAASTLAPGQGAGPFAVSFGTPFDTTPRVTVSLGSAPGGAQYFVPRVTGVTASGFSIYVYNVGPSATSATVSVHWIATDLPNA